MGEGKNGFRGVDTPERQRAAAEQSRARRERSWEVARRAAALLKEGYGASKIAAFGSLVQEDLFHPRSDIDLAMWGLEERRYFQAVGRLQTIDPDFSVDLVMVLNARPYLLEAIQREGISL